MARYGDGKSFHSAVFALSQNCLPNNILPWTLSPQIFLPSGRHHLWVQNSVVCVARGAHLNMLWICFVFILLNMRSGAPVEPWEVHFHIGNSCTYVNNNGLYLATEAMECHENLYRGTHHVYKHKYEVLPNTGNIWYCYKGNNVNELVIAVRWTLNRL